MGKFNFLKARNAKLSPFRMSIPGLPFDLLIHRPPRGRLEGNLNTVKATWTDSKPKECVLAEIVCKPVHLSGISPKEGAGSSLLFCSSLGAPMGSQFDLSCPILLGTVDMAATAGRANSRVDLECPLATAVIVLLR